MSVLLSIIFGAVPEMLFVVAFIVGSKGRELSSVAKRITLVVCYTIAYSITTALLQFNTWFHILLITLLFLILKGVDSKTEGIDLFLITIPYSIITLTGYVCRLFYYLLGYAPAYIINRILILFIIVALYPCLNKWYNAFRKVWNRNPNNKIKSITVRNILIVGTNILIVLLDFALHLI